MDKSASQFKQSCAQTGGGRGMDPPAQENPDLMLRSMVGAAGDTLAILRESANFTNNPGELQCIFRELM